MNYIKPIKNEEDHFSVLERISDIFDAKPNTPEGDELEILSILVEKYEETTVPIDMPNPIEAIKFRMEQMNLEQKDLVSVIGYKSRVSELLNKQRKLSLNHVRILSQLLNISPSILIQEY